MSLRGIWASFRFECGRSMALSRLSWCLGMALFPVGLLYLIRTDDPDALTDKEGLTVFLYFLIVRVLCPLGLLLWATPIIHSEIEGKTWPYVSVRPGGKTSVLFGKYFAAVLWTVIGGWVGLALAVSLGEPEDAAHTAYLLGRLVVLGSFTYGAVYTLIGVVFLKRAMVVTVAYTLLVEVALTLVPAVINEATVAFRLRALLVKELQLERVSEVWNLLISDAPASRHMVILAFYTVGCLVAALLVLRRRQLVLARED